MDPIQTLMADPAPSAEAEALAGQLLDRVSLDASGEPFNDDDPQTWAAADAAEPELVSLGPVRFRVIDPAAVDLAIAVGAVEAGDDDAICWLVEFDGAQGAPVPAIGQAVLLPTKVPGVTLPFAVWATYADFNDPAAPDLGPDADRNPALDLLEPNQALVVLIKDAEDVL